MTRPASNACVSCSATAASCRRCRSARGCGSKSTSRGAWPVTRCVPLLGKQCVRSRRLLLLTVAAACTPAPPVVLAPAVPAHPDFVFPAAPPGTPPATLERLERGWRLLQADDFSGAEREFGPLLRADRALHAGRRRTGLRRAGAPPAGRGPGGVRPGDDGAGRLRAGARRSGAGAAGVGPGRSGAGQLRSGPGRRPDVARRRLPRRGAAGAPAAGPGHARRTSGGRRALGRRSRGLPAAIAASPESPFLYRDLARAERRAGRDDAALEYARRALALDPDDARRTCGGRSARRRKATSPARSPPTTVPPPSTRRRPSPAPSPACASGRATPRCRRSITRLRPRRPRPAPTSRRCSEYGWAGYWPPPRSVNSS